MYINPALVLVYFQVLKSEKGTHIQIQSTVQRGALRRASLSRLTTVGVVDFGKKQFFCAST